MSTPNSAQLVLHRVPRDEFFDRGDLVIESEVLDRYYAIVVVGPTRILTLPRSLLAYWFEHEDGDVGYTYTLPMATLSTFNTNPND